MTPKGPKRHLSDEYVYQGVLTLHIELNSRKAELKMIKTSGSVDSWEYFLAPVSFLHDSYGRVPVY